MTLITTVTVRGGRKLDPGQRAVDVEVAAGSQRTRIDGWMYLDISGWRSVPSATNPTFTG